MIYFTTLLLSMFITIVLIPILKGLAVKVDAMDVPNPRKVHTKPIPLNRVRTGDKGDTCSET